MSSILEPVILMKTLADSTRKGLLAYANSKLFNISDDPKAAAIYSTSSTMILSIINARYCLSSFKIS